MPIAALPAPRQSIDCGLCGILELDRALPPAEPANPDTGLFAEKLVGQPGSLRRLMLDSNSLTLHSVHETVSALSAGFCPSPSESLGDSHNAASLDQC